MSVCVTESLLYDIVIVDLSALQLMLPINTCLWNRHVYVQYAQEMTTVSVNKFKKMKFIFELLFIFHHINRTINSLSCSK